MNDVPKAMLTTAEVAEMTGTNRNTLRYWRKVGKGPAYHKLSTNVVRYELADVLRWLSDARKNPTQ